ncbi:type 1 glutamine amidotransferase [Cellulosimicrobium arenosum]|uniref:Type 1 glutamine amidotransferase n=1 Tax=Cellulosimicrobium arenosum TaxID=2708133 RepID=A0A927G9J1_9MICO|nr:type 1 glutamine amidotransferase [Cellulosimicrobium arenosum]MBD8079054.1 type 1 glutamine amidotransferase [Cellulosimicrobium arenosum]
MNDESAVRLTVVQNDPEAPIGRFQELLAADLRVVRAYDGEPVPAAREVGDGLVVLGGGTSAYDDARAPWLPAVRALLHDAALSGVPTLAVCLGAQLLAVAAGGAVAVAPPPGRELGTTRIFWRREAAADPVLGALAASDGPATPVERVTSAHADAVVDLPDGAVWLASSNQYPYQAFRVGSALGVQFHPEASRELLTRWCERADDVDAADVLAAHDAHADGIAEGNRRLAEAFVAQVQAVVAQRAVPA